MSSLVVNYIAILTILAVSMAILAYVNVKIRVILSYIGAINGTLIKLNHEVAAIKKGNKEGKVLKMQRIK